MTSQNNKFDWGALDEINDRILAHADNLKLKENEKREWPDDGKISEVGNIADVPEFPHSARDTVTG